MRYVLLLALCSLLCTCDPAPFQQIELSDDTVERPLDGIGHYVYAATLPFSVAPGETFPLAMEWRTVGPVDASARYALNILLDGPAQKTYRYAPSNNTVGEYHLSNWQTYRLTVPDDLPAGTYTVAVSIENAKGNPVPLGFQRRLNYQGDYWKIATVEVK